VNGPIAQPAGLSDEQGRILETVHAFVGRDVLPNVRGWDRGNQFPAQAVDQMQQMGLFGMLISEAHGGLGESLLMYAFVVEELARGWMSLSGILNTHFIVAYLLETYGTPDQRQRFLPLMASGEIRGAFSMSEPGCGSDVAAISTRGKRDGEDWLVTGQKMWLTNGARSRLVALLTKTDVGAQSAYDNMTTFLLHKQAGFGAVGNGVTVSEPIEKMGYKGVETTELLLEETRLADSDVLGGPDCVGHGFRQMMDGIELGRVNVAARASGVAKRAFELAIRYAQERSTFGKPIAQHQAVMFSLAEMATKVEAAHQMMIMSAQRKASGGRSDLAAGMAKYLAGEYCMQVVEASLRIHGGYGYSKEFEIERLYRDAPLLVIGEGTAEMQKLIIGRRLLEAYRI
jgi:alkylation response protein AidB-like acyl-CoA dehydrogenase